MKKLRTYKWSINLLAAWLLFVSAGISINHHYCNDMLKKVAILIEPGCCDTAVCASEMTALSAQSCCSSSGDHLDDCCKTESTLVMLSVEATNAANSSDFNLDLDTDLFITIDKPTFSEGALVDGLLVEQNNFSVQKLPSYRLFQSILC